MLPESDIEELKQIPGLEDLLRRYQYLTLRRRYNPGRKDINDDFLETLEAMDQIVRTYGFKIKDVYFEKDITYFSSTY